MATEQEKLDKDTPEEVWKEKLTDKEYKILRKKGTERAFTGPFLDNKEEGIYKCRGCGEELFSSDTKYKSGCGWRSFYDGLEDKIDKQPDRSAGMTRTEILCKNCGGHLGHVFNDGPKDKTGKRYCVNGTSLEFEKTE